MFQQIRITQRLLGVAAAVALLAISARTAPGKGGGKNSATAVTIAFDDLEGDGIWSDGLGPYEGAINDRDGSLVLATGSRSFWFDFGWDTSPHEITDVTLTVSSLDGATATAEFAYRWIDLWSRSQAEDDWVVTMSVSVTRSGDTYYVTPTSDAEIWFYEHDRGYNQSGHSSPRWTLVDVVDLPWGATVSP